MAWWISLEAAFIMDISLAAIGFMVGKRNTNFIAYIASLLNYFLYYVVIPMVIFLSIFNAPSVGLYIFFTILSVLHICILMVSSFLLSSTIFKDSKNRISITILSSLPNAGYLAIPLAQLLLGTENYVTPYTIAFNILFSLSTLLIAFLRKSKGDLLDIVKLLPPILAIIATTILKIYNLDIGDMAGNLSIFTSYAVRTSFLVIGYSLANLKYSALKPLIKPFIMITLIKIPYSLLMAKAILYFIVAPSEFVYGFMLQSIMPPAINNIIIAKIFKLNEDLAAVSISILTPVSIALSPIVFIL